jgi:hypothetical protein
MCLIGSFANWTTRCNGWSARTSTRWKISATSRSPTSGTPSAAYHSWMPVRSLSADSAKLTLAAVILLGQAESSLGLGEGDLAAGVQIGQSFDHGAHEGALLRRLLVVGH